MSRRKKQWMMILLLALLAVTSTGCATQTTGNTIAIPTDLGQISTADPQTVSSGLQVMLLLSVLSLAPALLILVTAFTRIVIVLSFVRSALALPQIPPNQVLIGLSLFLTFFVMAPTWNKINSDAVQPYLSNQIDQQTAFEQGIKPVREFLFRQTRERDLALFVEMADMPRPETRADVPTYVLIPAFVISELKTAFQMGILVFFPFVVLDMIVASALMSMGMMMLPPSLVSMPFTLLLFVMVDGWHLVIRSLITSFGN